MRRIIYIPAIHNVVDMDGRGIYQSSLGLDTPDELKKQVAEHDAKCFDEIEKYWDQVRSRLDQKIATGEIDFQKTRLYTEGADSPLEEVLPYLKEATQAGSRHREIDLDLINKGAIYEITEAEELLNQRGRLILAAERAYRRANAWTPGIDGIRRIERWELVDRLGHKIDEIRVETDKSVASNIARTLQEGETGILIFGGNHEISQYLPKDIEFLPLHQDLLDLDREFTENILPFKTNKEPEGQIYRNIERR